MAQITKLPLSVTNLKTGLPHESEWEELESMSPKSEFKDMNQAGDVTNFLYFCDFQFNLAKTNASHRITGIEVNVLRKGVSVKDFWIDLVFPIKDDEIALTRNNKASDNLWSFIYTDTSYGGDQELWGRNWSLDDINSKQFGVVFAAKATEGAASADIKRVEIAVHYEELKLHFSKKELCLHKL